MASNNGYLEWICCEHERASLREDPVPDRISTTTGVAKFIGDVRVDYEGVHARVGKCAPYRVPGTDGVVLSSKLGGFVGQCSVVVSVGGSSVNIKVFANGSLQCTGVKHPRTGVAAIRVVAAFCVGSMEGAGPRVSPTGPWRVGLYRTVNINRGHRLGYEVCRDKLYRVLRTRGLVVDYEPAKYPGVVVKYFYNRHNRRRDGLCHCYDDHPCGMGGVRKQCLKRHGDGHEVGVCRRMSVSIFRSGSMLFTGSRTFRQLHEITEHILGICRRHRTDIEEKPFELEATPDNFEF